MDTIEDMRTTACFLFKKWALFTFCAIGIVTTIVFASISSIILDSYINKHYPKEPIEWRKSAKDVLLFMLCIATVLGVFCNWIGLLGAYLEHYCMTLSYAILISMESLVSMLMSGQDTYYWIETAISIIKCVLAYAFAYDLRKIKIAKHTNPGIVFINGGNMTNSTVVDMTAPHYPNEKGQIICPDNLYNSQSCSTGRAQNMPLCPTYSENEKKSIS